MSLTELMKEFDEAHPDAAFGEGHPIFNLALENDQLRSLCKEQHEALKATKEMIDIAHDQFNWGASVLDANAISLLNMTPSKVNIAIAKYQELIKENSI